MKLAFTVNGTRVEAGPGAPEQAVCPTCRDRLILRYRRTMTGTVTYFWRHAGSRDRSCPQRRGPIAGHE